MSDSFQFKCPFCEQILEVPLEAQGQVGNCPECNEEIVPSQEAVLAKSASQKREKQIISAILKLEGKKRAHFVLK
jgi:uncharacterized paraquat-inducible protein A